ncbi:MAG: HAMP domain-containing protein [Acidobacteria bacterium]|nr:HAMP domain-containing protein [Acidobacteriota bacterium]
MTAAAVMLAVLLIAVAWSTTRILNERRADVRRDAVNAAALEAANLMSVLGSFDAVAGALLAHPAVGAFDLPQANRAFASVLRDQPFLKNVLLMSPGGAVRASGLPVPPANLPQATPFVADVIREGKPVISDLSSGPEAAIILAYPVQNGEGEVAGVLGLALSLEQLQATFDALPLPERSVVALTDARGRLLAGSSGAAAILDPGRLAAVGPPPDAPPATGLDGLTRYFGTAAIARGPLVLSIGIPAQVALARVMRLWSRSVAIVLLVVGILLGLSLWLARLLHVDVNRLRLAVQRIADGDLSTPATSPMSNFELAALQSSFVTMAANLRGTRDALDRQVAQERRMREMVQSLERQVVRQERLAAVGLLVSGVAHELNNPLQAILGTAELLERSADLAPEMKEEVAFVKTQSARARDIIRNLSRFSSQQTGPPSQLELGDVIREVVQIRQRDLDASSIALEAETPPARRVLANFTEIEQVVLNFVINAQQSIEASGRRDGRIRIRAADEGRRVRLEVIDNGTGVSVADEPKLFQPFFTTKPVGKGTGLGLSVSYGIIESYGGAIGYRGNDWGGATFFFELAAVEPPPPAE